MNASVVWTGTEMIVWGGDGTTGMLNSGGRYDPATNTWTPTATGAARAAGLPHGRLDRPEMIVWGGYNVHIGQLYGDGARYSPATNSWTPVTATNAPDARTYHTAVWTGTEMIVWGGANEPAYDQTGGRYDPATDTWTPTSLVNAPSLRWFHVAVWTGAEMIVWGGSFGVVARRPLRPRDRHLGGDQPVELRQQRTGPHRGLDRHRDDRLGRPRRQLLLSQRRRPLRPAPPTLAPDRHVNVPAARGLHSAVWTGSEMIIWGGFSLRGLEARRPLRPGDRQLARPSARSALPTARENATRSGPGPR